MGLLLWKGFKDGSWRRQTGINSSIYRYAALVCNNLLFADADDPMSFFTSILKDIAEETILKTSAVPKRFNKPWFSDICKDAIKREPTEGNLNAYRIARAKARSDIRHSKKTSVKSVWNRILKIKVKDTSNTLHHLSVNDRDVTSHRDIANALADHFSHNSSPAFSTDAFASVRKKAEKKTLKFSSDNAEVYNKPLSMEELRDALRRAHDTSAGPDEIH